MRASGTDRQDRGFFGELLAAWIVVVVVVAVGFAATSFHEPGARHSALPRWYDPPVAGIQPPEDEALAAGETPTTRRPAEERMCNIDASSASYARAPASGAFAQQSGLPC